MKKIIGPIYRKQQSLSSLMAAIICFFLFFKLRAETRILNEERQQIMNGIMTTTSGKDDGGIMNHKIGNEPVQLWDNDHNNEKEVKTEKRQRILRMKIKLQLRYKSRFSPPNTLGAFIHVGKTGGSTISQLLRNGCHSYVSKPCLNETVLPEDQENVVSKLTTYYHIPDFSEGNLRKNHKFKAYEFFVITLRDPLSRAISAYAAGHPFRMAMEKFLKWKIERPEFHDFLKTKYHDDKYRMLLYILTMGSDTSSMDHMQVQRNQMYLCFERLEEFAQLLSNFNDYKTHLEDMYNDDGIDCGSVAKTSLHHKFEQPMEHNFWDLRQILYQVHQDLSTRNILAVRQEFLWQDWASANRWLGEENEIFNATMTERNSTTMDVPINLNLSEIGRKNICLALQDEYYLYLKLLMASENLSEDEVEESLLIARKNCPWLNLSLPSKGTQKKFIVANSQSWSF